MLPFFVRLCVDGEGGIGRRDFRMPLWLRGLCGQKKKKKILRRSQIAESNTHSLLLLAQKTRIGCHRLFTPPGYIPSSTPNLSSTHDMLDHGKGQVFKLDPSLCYELVCLLFSTRACVYQRAERILSFSMEPPCFPSRRIPARTVFIWGCVPGTRYVYWSAGSEPFLVQGTWKDIILCVR